MPHLPYGGRIDLSKVLKPIRYTGNELGATVKTNYELRFAFVFPEVYEVGMSYVGLQILYGLLNRQPYIWCERVFAPWPDMEQVLRASGEPLRTLESDTPVRQMDIVGFSLQHELVYTNFLNVLDLSGLPLRSAERDESYPLVIAGGPCTFNPAPVAPFIDAFVVGEGEDVVLELCDAVREAKKQKTPRRELLLQLAKIPGVFVPVFYETVVNRFGYVCFGKPAVAGIPDVVHKRIVDVETSYYPTEQIVPNGRVIQHRLSMEIMRGCPRGCRFCQEGFTDRPVRERSVERILALTRGGLKATGYDEVTLMSLSSGDYSQAEILSRCLIAEQESERVAISLPSLRLDGFSAAIPRDLERVRGGGLTFAPEAGTERLRYAINKFISDEDIFGTITRTFNKNWDSVKLYFMIGLPTETDEDVIEIARLSKRIRKHLDEMGWRRGRVHVSVGTFSPKPHIPFQWYGQIEEREALRRIHLIKREINHPKIKFNWHDTKPSRLEAALSRGDLRLADAIEAAYRKGARFDEWYENFRDDLWQEAFAERGLSMQEYASQTYEYEDVLPWDVISITVNKKYLWHEWKRTFAERGTFHCGNEKCKVCGVCDGRDTVTIHADEPSAQPAEPAAPPVPATTYRYRVAYEKRGPLTYASHQDLLSMMDGVLRRADLEVVYTQGFHPHPKLVYASALSVGVEGLEEYFDMETAREYAPAELHFSLEAACPPGMRILRIHTLEHDAPNVATLVQACRYRLESSVPTGWACPDEGELNRTLQEAESGAVLECVHYEGGRWFCEVLVERKSGNLPSPKRLAVWFKERLGDPTVTVSIQRTAQLLSEDCVAVT